MGSKSRTKGHTFERTVANDFREIFGDESIKRGLQSRNNMDLVPDVICPLFSVECKRYAKNPPINKAFKQALITSKKDGKAPLVISKADFEDALVTMSYESFRKILLALNVTLPENLDKLSKLLTTNIT